MIAKKLYRYWFFYYRDKNDELEFYAYTDRHSYAKRFMKERNMNKFEMFVHEIPKDMVHNLATDYGESILAPFLMETRCNYKELTIERLTTKMEEITVTQVVYDKMMIGLWEPCKYKKEIFNKKIQKSLEFLLYITYDELNGIADNYDKLNPDYFGCFMHYYGLLMKGEE